MELLEAASVFLRRHHRLFHSAAFLRFLYGCSVLSVSLYPDHIYCHPDAHLWRPGIGVAVTCLHHFPDQRCAAVLYRNSGTVPGKDLYGSEKKTDLSAQRRIMTIALRLC